MFFLFALTVSLKSQKIALLSYCVAKSPETNLIDMVKFRSLFRPVAVAQLLSVLGEAREHDHDDAALLPHHLPEVGRRVRHRAGGGDVRGVAGVVVRLETQGVISFTKREEIGYLLAEDALVLT